MCPRPRSRGPTDPPRAIKACASRARARPCSPSLGEATRRAAWLVSLLRCWGTLGAECSPTKQASPHRVLAVRGDLLEEGMA